MRDGAACTHMLAGIFLTLVSPTSQVITLLLPGCNLASFIVIAVITIHKRDNQGNPAVGLSSIWQ